MYNQKSILGLVPARGGSKALLKKNVRPLLGRPLVSWTIEQSLKSKYIDKVVVSTEDREIADISKKYGAEIINRPNSLAKDTSSLVSVAQHTLKVLQEKKNYNPDTLILLQPTSPLRTTEDIDNSIELFYNNNCESVVSVCEINIYWCLKIRRKYIEPIFGWNYFLKKRRQDIPKSYVVNGAIYVIDIKDFCKYNNFFTKKTLSYIMPKERSVDIDDEIDFKFAEFLKKEKNEKR